MVAGVKDCAMFLLTADGIVDSWNAGAERIKGYRADEIIGKHFSIFYPKEALSRGWPEFELKVAACEGRFEDEGWRVRKDGSLFWANVIITAWKDEAGRLAGFLKITRDITARREMELALRASEQRFRHLVMSVSDYAFILLDANGYIQSWNPGAERIKGYTEEEVIGKHFSIFYPPEANEHRWPEHELNVALREGRFEDEGWRIRKDGSPFWANVVITPFRDDNGELKGFWKITRDLTDRRRAEESLKRSNRELEQFASVAAHDLQEPLRKIQAFGDRLQTRCAGKLDGQSTDYLGRMLNSATRMRSLINDLLTFSRVTTKAQPFVRADLGIVAREVISDLEVQISQTGGRVDVARPLPVIEADTLQMRQLFQNLIGNALKFRKPDEPPVVVLDSKRVGSLLEITVRDNGIGFEELYLDRIFEVFQRLHGRQEYEGTGMGLAICKKIVERHGGSITARSTPGVGTTFIVKLPVQHKGRQDAGI
jgi:PAS domain S-box-containing protein